MATFLLQKSRQSSWGKSSNEGIMLIMGEVTFGDPESLPRRGHDDLQA